MTYLDPQLQHEQGPVDNLTEAERHDECKCDYCYGQEAKCEKCCDGIDQQCCSADGPDPDPACDAVRDDQYDRERMG